MNDTENNNREYEKKRDFGEAPANRIDERDVDFVLNGRRDLLVCLLAGRCCWRFEEFRLEVN